MNIARQEQVEIVELYVQSWNQGFVGALYSANRISRNILQPFTSRHKLHNQKQSDARQLSSAVNMMWFIFCRTRRYIRKHFITSSSDDSIWFDSIYNKALLVKHAVMWDKEKEKLLRKL